MTTSDTQTDNSSGISRDIEIDALDMVGKIIEKAANDSKLKHSQM